MWCSWTRLRLVSTSLAGNTGGLIVCLLLLCCIVWGVTGGLLGYCLYIYHSTLGYTGLSLSILHRGPKLLPFLAPESDLLGVACVVCSAHRGGQAEQNHRIQKA